MVYFRMAVFLNHHIIVSLTLEISLSVKYLIFIVFNLLIAFVQKWTKELKSPL